MRDGRSRLWPLRWLDLPQNRIDHPRCGPLARFLNQFHALVDRRVRRDPIQKKQLIRSHAQRREYFGIEFRQRLR